MFCSDPYEKTPQIIGLSSFADDFKQYQKVVRKGNKVKNSNTNNMSGFQTHCANWEKPDIKDHKLYDSVYLTFFQGQNDGGRKWMNRSGVGAGAGGGG